jgi:hypothetical protein
MKIKCCVVLCVWLNGLFPRALSSYVPRYQRPSSQATSSHAASARPQRVIQDAHGTSQASQSGLYVWATAAAVAAVARDHKERCNK